MPTREFSLEPDGPKRVKIEWKGMWKNIRVSFDDQPLGVIENQKALKAGADFGMPDGKTLHVELATGLQANLQVLLDGKPLPGSGNDPATQLKTAVGIVYFIAGLNVVVGVAAMAGVGFLLEMGLGWPTVVEGTIIGGLGYWVQERRSKAALIVVMALVAASGILSVMVATEAGHQPPIGGTVVRVLFLLFMFTGLKAIDKLEAKG